MASAEKGAALVWQRAHPQAPRQMAATFVATAADSTATEKYQSGAAQPGSSGGTPGYMWPSQSTGFYGRDNKPDDGLVFSMSAASTWALALSNSISTVDTTKPTFAGISGATPASRTSVTVSWTQATDDVTAQANIWYEIHFATSAGAGFSPKRVVQGTGSLLVDGLSVGTTYYFRVRARDEAGNYSSSASQAVELSATTTADTAPTFGGVATATQITKEVVRLTWSAASDDFDAASSLFYSVHQSTSPAASFTEVYRTLPNVTLYDVKGLTAGTTYYFKVRANDTQGNRDANVVELSVTVTNNPPTFVGISGVTRVGYDTLRLSWAAANDDYDLAAEIEYAIHVSTSPAASFSETYRAPPGSTTFDVGGLTIGTTYYFKVRAIDIDGNSDTNVVELSGSCTDVAPTFAGLVSISNPTSNQVQLTWLAGSDDITTVPDLVYAIHVATSASQPFTEYCRTPPGDLSIVLDLVTAGTYYFRARAVDQAGNYSTDSGPELSASSTGGGSPDVTAPTFAGLVSASTGVLSGTVDLSWAAATDDTTAQGNIVYEVSYASSPGQPFSVRWVTAPGATSVTISGLFAATTYYFRVRARDEAGNVDANAVELSAVSGFNVGDAPQIVNVVPVSGTTITATSTISFDVIDLTNPIRRVIITVTHGSKANVTEVVHNGTEFKGAYQYVSTIETIPNGYRYTLKRTGGWFSSPYFEVFAIDTTGLES